MASLHGWETAALTKRISNGNALTCGEIEAMADQAATDQSAQFISRTLDSALRRSRWGRKLWSFANHGATILIVVFSAAAAVLAQTPGKVWIYDPRAVATILSLCVTV